MNTDLLSTVNDLLTFAFMDLSKVKPRFGVEKQSTSILSNHWSRSTKTFRGKKKKLGENSIILFSF